MVVKSELKFIKSLQQKKYRNQHGLFVMEGKKAVEELLASQFKVYKIFTDELNETYFKEHGAVKIHAKDFGQISSLKNPNGVLGVFHIPKSKPLEVNDWVLALDGVQDPGNMGTIIRLCDWYGIENIICSNTTVDCYNPKVLQATMGSIARVSITYLNLPQFLGDSSIPVYGTFMDGENVNNCSLPNKGILVVGNEGSGISQEVKQLCHKAIAIPQYGSTTAESLNVGTATAILLNEIRK
ncbi:TrmH family RNA methyltransferase [Maribacter sp. CXY002]|uniref:TrmH family RNA methyltransferase n=1 Tax=Maribacter luteocoastalis TaxID=3407671 RepID=UPI003B675B42